MKVFVALALLVSASAQAYPTDEYERTQMRRLRWQHEVDQGSRRGTKTKPGAHWPSSRIQLKLTDTGKDYRLTPTTVKDPELQPKLEAVLRKWAFRAYNVALLDITDPQRPRYAGVNDQDLQTPGSVAKLLVAAALFQALKDRFPNDIAAREAFLRDTKITADDWAMPNHHEVPVVNGDQIAIRAVKRGDTFSLWEWVDHAISPSSNAAASMVWREVTLLNLLGAEYPPKLYDKTLFDRWDKATFSAAAFAAIDRPLQDVGIDPAVFNLRLFFTKGPSKYIDGDQSNVSPMALVQWMLAVEQGRLVDAWSSLELKRLLYLTRRRVRYAKAPELNDSAVFFKSGSLFRCVPEEGYTCVQYEGNAVNVLNTLVEIETPPPAAEAPATLGAPAPVSPPMAASPPSPVATPSSTAVVSPPATSPSPGAASPPPAAPGVTKVYIVAVMSNELKKNAAEDHGRLASAIYEFLKP